MKVSTATALANEFHALVTLFDDGMSARIGFHAVRRTPEPPSAPTAPLQSDGIRLALLGAAAVTLAALWHWKVWDNGLRGPLAYEGDALLYQRLARTIAERGWYQFRNPTLGAPTGQLLHDYPLAGDNVHYAFMRLLAFATDNPFTITNLYFYLSFPLAYFACLYALRRLDIATAFAVPASVLYALAPYHFQRGVIHLTLSTYYAVPLGCLLLYELAKNLDSDASDGQAQTSSQVDGHLKTWLRSRQFWAGRWLWVPVLIGSAGAYYAFFFVFLAGAVAALSLFHRETWQVASRSLVIIALTLSILALHNAPSLLYRAENGSNQIVGKRAFGDSDNAPLQPTFLFLPIPSHRVDFLADLRARAERSVSPLPGLLAPALGGTTAVGLAISLVALFTARRRGDHRDRLRRVGRQSGMLNMLTLLLGCAGGGSLLLGFLGFVQLREYGRLVVFMTFFCLAALAASVEALVGNRHRSIRIPRLVVGTVVLTLVTLLALLDHAPALDEASRKKAQLNVREDRHMAAAIEQRLPNGAMILEIPLLGFPEDIITFPARAAPSLPVISGFEFYNGYELFRPTLYTRSLRWSYGAIQNRPGDLMPWFANKPVSLFLQQAVAVGYDGIYLDRRALPDEGIALLSQLTMHLGEPDIQNALAVFYDLRPYRDRVSTPAELDGLAAIRAEAQRPLHLLWRTGFDNPDGNGRFFPQLAGFSSGRWAAAVAELEVYNPTSSSRMITLHATARTGTAAAARLSVVNDSRNHSVGISPAGVPLVLQFVLAPGTNKITFSTDTNEGIELQKPSRTVVFRLEDVWWQG